ncbi:MFS transporter [Rickettsiales bacterium]|nr:MFS transporter [Rickettsiales bacterium]
MLSTIYSVSALLLSFGILCLGHGLNNTLLGVRATIESYPEWVTGLMMSGYFMGFIIGTSICAKLIPKVGQIRTFAAFASISSSISLLHVLFINEITWVILRIVYGVCIAALYMVIESWLNALSTKQNRGRILSVYMVISFLSLALGQIFVFVAEPSQYILFAIVSILISFSLVPLSLSKTKQPEEIESGHFSFKKLYKISPLATIGCAATGLTLGAFWGLSAVYFTQLGLPPREVAILISATFLGGLIFQWPIGYLSDLFDRRVAISLSLFLSTVISIQFIHLAGDSKNNIDISLVIISLLFGGFSYTLYSLFIALANDFLEPQYIVKASGGLITFHAIGAMLGPFLVSILMSLIGNNGLFVFIAVINSIIFTFALIQIIRGRKIPEKTSESFISIPKTGTAIIELDPRQEESS